MAPLGGLHRLQEALGKQPRALRQPIARPAARVGYTAGRQESVRPPRPAPPKAQGPVPGTLRQKDWQRPGDGAILTGERLHPMQPTEGASGGSSRTSRQSLR
jgi:hypothetical protein